VLFDEAYIGNPLGIAGTLDLSSRLTRSILGSRSLPPIVALLGDVPMRSLLHNGFVVALAGSVAQPLVAVERPPQDLPAGTTRSYRLAKVYFENAVEQLEAAAVERTRQRAGVEFLVGISSVPVARLERVVDRRTSVTTDRWAANVEIHARIRRVSDSKTVWRTTATCRGDIEKQYPSSVVLDNALADAAKCAIGKLAVNFRTLLNGSLAAE
jgi:hypothetical protein